MTYYSIYIPIYEDENEWAIFSKEGRDDLKYITCHLLHHAEEKILFSSFAIDEEDVAKKLGEKALQGVDITVHTDGRQYNLLPKDPKITIYPYKGSGLMHRKIVGVDNKYLLLGSTNCTENSYFIHKNLGILITSPPLFKAIEENAIYTAKTFTYYPLPQEAKPALANLLEKINGATKHIYIAMYTFTHNDITEALINAKKRGDEVRLFIDRSMAKGVCKQYVKKLLDADIKVAHNIRYGLLHYKCAMIDDTFVFGSVNWTKAGFSKNQEYILIKHETSLREKKKLSLFFALLNFSSQQLEKA